MHCNPITQFDAIGLREINVNGVVYDTHVLGEVSLAKGSDSATLAPRQKRVYELKGGSNSGRDAGGRLAAALMQKLSESNMNDRSEKYEFGSTVFTEEGSDSLFTITHHIAEKHASECDHVLSQNQSSIARAHNHPREPELGDSEEVNRFSYDEDLPPKGEYMYVARESKNGRIEYYRSDHDGDLYKYSDGEWINIKERKELDDIDSDYMAMTDLLAPDDAIIDTDSDVDDD